MIVAGRIQELFEQLEAVMNDRIVCGTLTLNINEARVQSYKIEKHRRIAEKVVDQRAESRHT